MTAIDHCYSSFTWDCTVCGSEYAVESSDSVRIYEARTVPRWTHGLAGTSRRTGNLFVLFVIQSDA